MPKNEIHSNRIKKEKITNVKYRKYMYLLRGRGRYCWPVESGTCCIPK
jgi:hypothetical protein